MMTGRAISDLAATRAVLDGCVDACRRCETVVRLVQTAPPEAARAAFGAIGPHLRHCVDHFLCLFGGLESGIVDYDARERDRRLETDLPALRAALEAVGLRLSEIEPGALGRPLRVRQTAAPGAPPVTVGSNVERELVFLSGHTIHHLAIMTILLVERGLAVPQGLDVAYSTAVHLNAAADGDP